MDGDLAGELHEEFGEIWCLTFVRGVDGREALRRFGAYPETAAPRTLEELGEMKLSFDAGYPTVAAVTEVGGWAVVLEPEGFEAAHTLLEAVSVGTEAVSVLRHDYASDRFGHAADGVLLTGFDPDRPGRRWGAEPDRHGVFGEEDDERDDAWALALAGRLAGGLPSLGALAEPWLSAEFDPWFTPARPTQRLWGDDADLIAAIEGAGPAQLRAVAVGEVRRIAGLLGVADAPGLDHVLREAAEERFPGVPTDSALGGVVRGWLRLGSQASWSLNLDRYRMSEGERHRGYLFGWFTGALRGALEADPVAGAHAALYPLAKGPAPLKDPAARAAAVGRLRA
ncbi:DUF6461 domain-containing protein [Dactylosporangium sp. AC04546]|uniref:DUF6461 domain-containing protein n=1 Tax=Dactylosporangium sp. AC04546 TaxID=2862460 RepID=UPI001EDF7770|nr:DUF6461 domain-containing protein [Dactylosporangium sp. AC04546]WVK87784.1 DUF6461 domain-containing protein [Dactylosporangium sp. AC04546]